MDEIKMAVFEIYEHKLTPEKAEEYLKALIIRVTDEIIGEDEACKGYIAGYPPSENVNKCGQCQSQNKLRKEQRIKRDELLK